MRRFHVKRCAARTAGGAGVTDTAAALDGDASAPGRAAIPREHGDVKRPLGVGLPWDRTRTGVRRVSRTERVAPVKVWKMRPAGWPRSSTLWCRPDTNHAEPRPETPPVSQDLGPAARPVVVLRQVDSVTVSSNSSRGTSLRVVGPAARAVRASAGLGLTATCGSPVRAESGARRQGSVAKTTPLGVAGRLGSMPRNGHSDHWGGRERRVHRTVPGQGMGGSGRADRRSDWTRSGGGAASGVPAEAALPRCSGRCSSIFAAYSRVGQLHNAGRHRWWTRSTHLARSHGDVVSRGTTRTGST